MILAEKIMQLRKKNGWSQEELAEQLNVSRQSVSKWESAQSIPDLNKILLMSDLFAVSTDYLLKDNGEYAETQNEPQMDTAPINSDSRFVSMEDANRFLDAKELTAPRIALAVSLCILSPIPLIFLSAISETNGVLTEELAAGIGLTVLFIIVAVAVAMFMSCRTHTAEFDYLDEEPIETAYGIISMAKELQSNYSDRYNRNNMIGVILCIISVIPLFVFGIMSETSIYGDFIGCCGISIMLAIIAFAVNRMAYVGIIWESYHKLLQEGDYSREKKSQSGFNSAYSSIVTAIYLLYSFCTGNWHISWLIWPLAGPIRSLILSIYKKI